MTKQQQRRNRLRNKKREISKSGNLVSFTNEELEHEMNKHGFDYKTNFMGDIIFNSKNDRWKLVVKHRYIELWHRNKFIPINSNKEYHLQNVFYDLKYCLEQVSSHDDYTDKYIIGG